MNRREFLKKLGLAAAGALIVSAAVSAAETAEHYAVCAAQPKKKSPQPEKKSPQPNEPKSPERGGRPNLATLFGRVRVVSAGERFKVRIVTAGEDLRVRVTSAALAPGQWEFVSAGEKFTIRFVDAGEDFKIRFVSAGEGF